MKGRPSMHQYADDEIRALTDMDRRCSWKPFTQMREYMTADPLIIAAAEGDTLIDVRGRRFFDGVSSLWCNLLGHRHPAIDAAVRAQLERVAHSTLLGPTHVPAIRLAGALARITPPGLDRVFFSDNGSTGNEVALKMAFQFQQQTGRPERSRFVSLRDGYHGDTLGAVGVGGIELFHAKFKPLLMDTLIAPAPYCYRCELAEPDRRDEPEILFYPDVTPPVAGRCGMRCLDALDRLLAASAGQVCAMILEPVIQGACGIHGAAPGYLAGARGLCRRHGVLMIVDEVATGFGRTGRLFACEHENVSPDLLVLAKGLTGGYSPLAATLATQEIFEAFLGEYTDFRTFFHGHTFTGHPLGAAAALAVIDLIETEGVVAGVAERNAIVRKELQKIAEHQNVGRVHLAGLFGGIELVADRRSRAPFDPARRVSAAVCHAALAHGLLIRPLADTIVIMPPLTASPDRLAWMCDVIRRCIAQVLGS